MAFIIRDGEVFEEVTDRAGTRLVKHIIVYHRTFMVPFGGTWKTTGWQASRAGHVAFGKTRKLAAAALRELERSRNRPCPVCADCECEIKSQRCGR